jgi:hypothetical protein
MIALFTDFGRNGPYQGQMKNALYRAAPQIKVIDLMADAPSFNPYASSHLLASLVADFAEGMVFLCVVDPGVGSDREPCIVYADGYWFVGPNNGLFSVIAERSNDVRWWRITWMPERLSSTFHGRDLFAPVAAKLALDKANIDALAEPSVDAKPILENMASSVIYIDDFGNVMTSILSKSFSTNDQIDVNGERVPYANTFSDCRPGQRFWYCNSQGLVEIAMNQGSVSEYFGCKVGDRIIVIKSISS